MTGELPSSGTRKPMIRLCCQRAQPVDDVEARRLLGPVIDRGLFGQQVEVEFIAQRLAGRHDVLRLQDQADLAAEFIQSAPGNALGTLLRSIV